MSTSKTSLLTSIPVFFLLRRSRKNMAAAMSKTKPMTTGTTIAAMILALDPPRSLGAASASDDARKVGIVSLGPPAGEGTAVVVLACSVVDVSVDVNDSFVVDRSCNVDDSCNADGSCDVDDSSNGDAGTDVDNNSDVHDDSNVAGHDVSGVGDSASIKAGTDVRGGADVWGSGEDCPATLSDDRPSGWGAVVASLAGV